MSEMEVPEGWELKKLSDLIEIHSGYAFKSQDYTKEGIFVLRTLNIESSGKINRNNSTYLQNSALTKYPKYVLKKDDVLMVMVGATIGKIGIVEESILPALLNQNMWLFRPEKINSRFLFYLLKNLIAKHFSNLQGSGREFFHINDFREMFLPIPSITIQKEIVKKLDHVLKRIEEKKKEILKLNSAERLTNFLESNKFTILQLIRTGFFSQENWNEYPKMNLGEITRVTSGSTPSRGNPEYWNGDIPWIKSGELLDEDIHDSEEHITKKGLINNSTKLFPKDTILVALYGQGKTRGKTGRLLIEASTNQAVCGIFPNSDFLSEYIQFWIRSMYLELRKTAVGGAQPNWNTTTIKKIEITLPPLDEQKKILGEIKRKLFEMNSFEKQIEFIIEQKNRNLKYINHIQSSVLDSAFSGKLVR